MPSGCYAVSHRHGSAAIPDIAGCEDLDIIPSSWASRWDGCSTAPVSNFVAPEFNSYREEFWSNAPGFVFPVDLGFIARPRLPVVRLSPASVPPDGHQPVFVCVLFPSLDPVSSWFLYFPQTSCGPMSLKDLWSTLYLSPSAIRNAVWTLFELSLWAAIFVPVASLLKSKTTGRLLAG